MLIRLFLILAILVGSLGLSLYPVASGEKAVVLRWGGIHRIVEEGWHLIIPGIEKAFKADIAEVHELCFGFRKKKTKLSSQKARRESLMLTGDLNVVWVEWILQYRISDPEKYFFRLDRVEKSIRDVSISMMRRVVGDRMVNNVLNDRAAMAREASLLIQEVLNRYEAGVEILRLSLQNVTPPQEVKSAFQDINIAMQDQEYVLNQARSLYNKSIPEAQGKAAKLISEAEGRAQEIKQRSLGDNFFLKEMIEAYRKNPQSHKTKMYWDAMDEILSEHQNLTVVDPKVPFWPVKDSLFQRGGE